MPDSRPPLDPKSSRARILELEEEVAGLTQQAILLVGQRDEARRDANALRRQLDKERREGYVAYMYIE